ncbi:MAG TPA: universal stress protein [Stellaceae bacterium]|jgi:nucleotide-binding universal stress UspA family protein|nr:universal stress protein [Stellaceae bacterium]
MIKTILVAASGDDGDAATFAAALAIAQHFAAHLDVLHVRVDAVSAAVAMMTDAGSGAAAAGLIEQLEQDASGREAKARDIFTRFCRGAKLAEISAPPGSGAAAASAEWHVETGDEPRWMAAYGVAADLIVAPRATGEAVLARTTLEAVLLETGRPLVIPAAAPMPASFARIAIAWKPTPQAARAVALAMPFLARAKEVVVITVDEEAGAGDAAAPLVRNLLWHGLSARTEQLKPGPEGAAATLLAGARERADLLVMGGYGHTRLREWVFGGFTQSVLDDAPLAVLIAH